MKKLLVNKDGKYESKTIRHLFVDGEDTFVSIAFEGFPTLHRQAWEDADGNVFILVEGVLYPIAHYVSIGAKIHYSKS